MFKELRLKSLFLAMLVMITGIAMASCSKDDDEPQEPYAKEIVGTWKLSKVSTDGSNYLNWMFETTTATFNSDGTYSGRGYFGNGSGTYKLKGSTLTTYIDGESYLIYNIIDLSGSTATFKISIDGSTTVIYAKAIKQ